MKIPFSTYLYAWLAVLISFAVLDGLWLGVIAMPLYTEHFAGLLREPFITWPWLAFYVLYCMAVVFLAIRPTLEQSMAATGLHGLVLGATAYGTYNLTAYSIVAGWPLNMTLIDWLWGAVATMLLAIAGGTAACYRLRRLK